MADTAIAITSGAGTNVDTRTESTNGNHRQVIVLGDPATNAGVAPVDATAGLKVDLGADNDVTVTSGTLAATQSGTWTVQPGNTANTTAWKVDGSAVTQPVSGTVTATVATIGTSVTPGTSAAHLGKAEDAAHSSGDTGVMSLAVRNDTAAALAGTTGDYIPFTTNARGATWIAIEDGAGGQVTSFTGGTQYTEDAAAAANPVGTVLIGVRRDTLSTSEVSADGDNIAASMTNKGQVHVYADLGTQVGSLGRVAAASSTSVTLATEDVALLPASLGQKTSAASLAVVLPSDQSLTVASTGYSSGKVTVTRAANTTAYTAGDIVGGAITFPTMGPSGGGQVLITSASLAIHVSAIPSGMTTFTLHLYNVTPPSAVADNGVFDIPSGDRVSHLGIIAMGTPVDYGATLKVRADAINQTITVPSGGSLFGYLVTDGAFTPAGNSEVYVVTLHSVAL